MMNVMPCHWLGICYNNDMPCIYNWQCKDVERGRPGVSVIVLFEL